MDAEEDEGQHALLMDRDPDRDAGAAPAPVLNTIALVEGGEGHAEDDGRRDRDAEPVLPLAEDVVDEADNRVRDEGRVEDLVEDRVEDRVEGGAEDGADGQLLNPEKEKKKDKIEDKIEDKEGEIEIVPAYALAESALLDKVKKALATDTLEKDLSLDELRMFLRNKEVEPIREPGKKPRHKSNFRKDQCAEAIKKLFVEGKL